MNKFVFTFLFAAAISSSFGDELKQSLFKQRIVTIPKVGWWDSFDKTYKQMSADQAGLVDCCLWCSMSDDCGIVSFNQDHGACNQFKDLTSILP